MAGKRVIWRGIPGFSSYESNGLGDVRNTLGKKKVDIVLSLSRDVDTYVLKDLAGHDEAITSGEIVRRTFPEREVK